MPDSVTRSGRPGAIPELHDNAPRTTFPVRLVSAMERAASRSSITASQASD